MLALARALSASLFRLLLSTGPVLSALVSMARDRTSEGGPRPSGVAFTVLHLWRAEGRSHPEAHFFPISFLS